MKPQDSRPITDLSGKEISEYFEMPPPKPLTYPDSEFCELHAAWFIGRCPQCIGEANLTVESFEECNLGCLLPMPRKVRSEKRTTRPAVPRVGYQYQNFLAENQK